MAILSSLGAFVAANIGTIGTAASLAGAGLGAAGTIASARAAQAAGAAKAQQAQTANLVAKTQAKQLEAKGQDEFAGAQKRAMQFQRQKVLALSRLQARGAASGFSSDDPTALQLAGEIEQHGTLQEQLALFGGRQAQSGLQQQAKARRFAGAAGLSAGAGAVEGAQSQALGILGSGFGNTLASAGDSLRSKFAKKQFVADEDAGDGEATQFNFG